MTDWQNSFSAAIQTRAMRRAAAVEDRRQLRRLRKAARDGAVVANENKTPMPPELGKVCWSVELGDASLNWNADDEVMAEAARHFERMLDASGVPLERRRHTVRALILQIMAANDHVKTDTGACVIGAATWLAMTGEGAAMISARQVSHCGFLILPTASGGGEVTFRMIAGWRAPEANVANDNASAAGSNRGNEPKVS